jgi:uncharacterized lipoprotein YddW (UPF0748 family)
MPELRPPRLSRRGVLGAAGVAAVGGAAVWTGATAFADPSSTDSGKPSCEPNPAQPKEQFRASWIATTVNIDWPSKAGLDVDTQKAEYQRFLDDAHEYRLNAVITQVRPTADAFWPSRFEPWSRWLTGEQGKDPGYDPLGYAVEATHAADLEIHAWLNPYRISMKAATGDVGGDLSKLHDSHPAKAHPEWVVTYPKTDGQLYYNPGIPEVRQFVIDAMMDAVDNYDIDGVHFDDYFYPYPVGTEDFDDEAAYAEYGGDFDNKADWRRNNTDELIKEFGRRIKESKPWVKFGVSPFGVWRNKADDPDGSDTDAGAPTYDVLYADTRKWVREGWIDYIAPQVYWAISLEVASYKTIVEWWNEVCEGTDCQLYIGEGVYKVGNSTQSPEWNNEPRELLNHLTLCRDNPEVDGNIYYSAKSVRADVLQAMTLLRDEHYSKPALLPAAEQLGGRAPHAPKVTELVREDDGYTVRWRGRGHGDGVDETAWYAVYAVSGKPDHCTLADAGHLVAVRHATGDTEEFHWQADEDDELHVAVTAINRAWQEGKPGVKKAR